MIQRLSRTAYLHPWRTVAVWLVALAAVVAASGALGEHFADGGRLRGSDSDRAYQLLARDMPAGTGDTATIVVHDARGVADPAVRAAVDPFVARARGITPVGTVSDPFVSADGTTELFTVDMPDHARKTAGGDPLDQAVADDLVRAAAAPRASGVQVEFGGYWFTEGDVPAYAEKIGLAVAIVVLLLVFGSLVAVGVALAPALLAVVGAGAAVTVVSHLVATPDFTTIVATMIGLGVGIDYALVIISRFRRELQHREPIDALHVAIGTAGRAVLLAGSIVAVSLLGMMLIGLEFLHGLSIGAAVAVAISVVSALTLLPALLRWSTRSMTRHARKAAARPARETVWHRWGRAVAARPVVALVGGLAVLFVLAMPLFSIRLASADAGNDPPGSTTRAAYDLEAAAFGPGVNGPLVVVVDGATLSSVAGLSGAIAATTGVAAVQPPAFSANGHTAALGVIPTTPPQERATEQLVHRLRDDTIPASGVDAHVGGRTASDLDFAELLRHRLPWFIGGVLACSFLLLLVVFRSILVPLKAVVLNLLSIGAAFGAMVAVFQWGWFGGHLGVHGGPIEAWAPMLLFAIVFGLSMDYEVFLLSAIKEHYDNTGDNTTAVVEGLSSTAKVITAAAAIMVAVFGSFLGADLRAVQLVGFGLAAAVLVDATVVRMLLVPASMELLGDRNWWFPRFIGASLPAVHMERAELVAAVDVTASESPIEVEPAVGASR
jgi:RND superfamily putative drug exporter